MKIRGKTRKVKLTLFFTLCIVFMVASVCVYAKPQSIESNNDSNYEINSLKELKQETDAKEELTKKEQNEILKETDPKVLNEYSNYVDKVATEIVKIYRAKNYI